MKRAFFGVFLCLFLLSGAAVFAQENENLIDAFLGFQYNIDIKTVDSENTIFLIPSLALGARQYLIGGGGIYLGYIVTMSIGSISEMEWAGITVKAADADTLMNIGALIGVSLRSDIGYSGFGFVIDAGFVVNADIASFKYTDSADSSHIWDFTTYNYGIGLNGALQARVPLIESALLFELGANFSYCFTSETRAQYTVDGTKTDYDYGSNDDVSRMRIAPYVVIGLSF